MGLALLAAVAGLIALALFGPDEQQLQTWLFHTGVEGELRILPELQIIQDTDPITQPERRTMAGATEGMNVEVVDRPLKPLSPDSDEPAPRTRGVARPTIEWNPKLAPRPDVGDQPQDRTRMIRPSQRSLDFVLVKLVRPIYPAATPDWLRRKKVVVDVAVYVEADGKVSDAYILRSNGGPLFSQAVLQAVRQWEYRYVGAAGQEQPFWDQVRWIFEPRSAGDSPGAQ